MEWGAAAAVVRHHSQCCAVATLLQKLERSRFCHLEKYCLMAILLAPKPKGPKKMKKAVIALLAAACAMPAFAGETYVGASVGRSEQKLGVEGFSLSENATAFKVFGGYQFTPAVGAEIGYAHFGKVSISDSGATASAEPSAFYAAVTGTLPLTSQISAFGKLGVARDHTKVGLSYEGQSDSESMNETSAVFGLGVNYAVSPKVAVFAEYENFGKVAKGDGDSLKVDHVSVGLRVKF
jgi:OOP family OmpA-OmpF porin